MNPLAGLTADQIKALRDAVAYEAAQAARNEVDAQIAAQIAQAKREGLVLLAGLVALFLLRR